MAGIDARIPSTVRPRAGADVEADDLRSAGVPGGTPGLQQTGDTRAVALSGALSGHLFECTCPVCRAGDALPAHLQGIPGAKQLTFVETGHAAVSTFERQVRDACRERCAEFGDPPCYRLDLWDRKHPTWCRECRAEAGDVSEDPEPLDPAAVIGPLL